MLFRNLLFPTVIVPALVAGLVHLVGGWRGFPDPVRRSVAPLALAWGYAAAHAALSGLPRMPPPETTEWLFHLAVIAGLLAAIEPPVRRVLARHPDRLAEGMRYFLLGSVIWLTLRPLVAQNMSRLDTGLWLAGVGLAAMVSGLAWDALAQQPSSWFAAAVWALTGSGAAAALGLSSSARLGQLCGATVAVVVAGQLVCVAGRQRAFTQPAVSAALMLLVGLLLNGLLYADLPVLSGLLLLAAPGATWLVLRRPAAAPAARLRWLAALLAAALSVAAAVAIAAVERSARGANDPYAYGRLETSGAQNPLDFRR